MTYDTSHGIRWNARPATSGALRLPEPGSHEPACRVAPWGNAMRLELDHAMEVAALTGSALREVGL